LRGSLKYKIFLTLIFTFVVFSAGFAQEEFYHPELQWQTIETKHFLVHFHNGAERTAHEVAKIAESIYGPVTSMYDHEPDQRVSLIIRDHDDISNGAAYFYENRIELWAPSLDFEFRGTHPWLWNVVTHEFTHIIQIQVSIKFGRKIPGFYLQWLGYENERRPDVLYGYPNVIASYPFSGFLVPSWFAEGTAQYNNPMLGYDYWDSHREMILRMYMIDGNPLGWEEMGVFGKTSLGNESSYNAGFSLVAYIARKYGLEKLQEISRQLAAPFRLTIDGAIEKTLGRTGEQLYDEWKTEKTNHYLKIKDSLSSTLKEGVIIENDGFGNFYPVFSSDGSKLAYISNKGKDYLSLSSVYLYDLKTKTKEKIVSLVRSSLSFSPDGRYLYYARIDNDNPHWSGYSDLFRYDLKTKEEERLTYGLRAYNPKLSSDGNKLVFAYGGDGTLNIGTCFRDGKNIVKITNFQNGEQVYTPVWSNDGKKIAFGYSIGHNESVALVDSNGENYQLLTHAGDCRNPFFASDSALYYSWDRGGIFNIYSLNLKNNIEQQETNVLGGAFLPTLDKNDNLIYVTYTSSGYKIALLNQDSSNMPASVSNSLLTNKSLPFNQVVSIVEEKSNAVSTVIERNYPNNKDTISSVIRPYKPVFTSISFLPFLRFDNYTQSGNILDMIKPGLYITSSEVLNKIDIFGSAAMNRKWERDLFLIIGYRGSLPLLYQLGLEPAVSLELYSISRKRDVSFDLYVYKLQTFKTDVTYNLFEFDISLTQKLFTTNCDLSVTYTLSRYDQDFGSWLHPDQVVPASRSTYLIGNTFSAKFKYDGIERTLDKDINPIGRMFSLKYFYEMNKYNPTDSAKYKDGFRIPVYLKYNINRLELDWKEHLALPFDKHTLTLGISAAGIMGDSVDDFFDYYAGGFIGMRGYPFYAIGGNKSVALNATYRFPIATEMNFRVLQLYFKKLYGSVFYDIGDAWTKEMPSINKWKRDVGFELRLETFSFYAFPTRIFLSGAYGLDKFSREVQQINKTTIQYGHEWRFYLGVLFGFELNDIFQRQLMR
jgi:Tol biopolymer transport system component